MLLLGSPGDKVAPAARILGSVIRLAMNLLDDREIGRPESLDDVLGSVTPKVQRDLSAEQFVPMDNLLTNMKRDKRQAPRHEDSSRLPKDCREFGQVEVHDGVEQYYPGETCVARAEAPHVFDAKVEIGMQALGHRDHLRGKVDPKDRDALLAQIPGNMARPTAEIGDETAATSLFRKPIQEMPVEWLASELV